MREAVLS